MCVTHTQASTPQRLLPFNPQPLKVSFHGCTGRSCPPTPSQMITVGPTDAHPQSVFLLCRVVSRFCMKMLKARGESLQATNAQTQRVPKLAER